MSPSGIWEILVEHAGADPGGLVAFMEEASRSPVMEYRFQGMLGFGGKVWLKPSKTPYVTCYPEDLTDDRERAIEKTNDELRKLYGEPTTSGPTLSVLGQAKDACGQVTACAYGEKRFFVRERVREGKQVLELASSQAWDEVARIVKVEDSLGREVVRNDEFTEEEARKLF